ncbi:MAG: hypothetical protein AABX31_01510 [Nanoarchaeota archaeon]
MARILYGAPESEREEENGLVARLRRSHKVEYLNEFLGFAFELSRCKDLKILPLPRPYDLIVYDTKTYGENWHPDIRAENFKITISPFLVRSTVPVIVLADELIKEEVESWIEMYKFHYLAQPYSIDKVVKKVHSLLPKNSRRNKR